MLADPSRGRARGARRDPLPANEVVLHTDRSPAAAPPAGLGELELPPQDEPVGRTTVTYHMNRLQSLRRDREFCVTLNRSEAIDPERGDPRRSATPTRSSPPPALAAQGRWAEMSGRGGTHFCGAYWGYGFHEDGVASARCASASASGGRSGERQLRSTRAGSATAASRRWSTRSATRSS